MDNSAVIYPMVITKRAQSLFSLGVELTEPIDKGALLAAINRAFERYPFYKVRIRYGLFRPFWEENPLPYVISPARQHLQLIPFRQNNGYLFETHTVNNRIYMVFFHALCDATGGMEFLKTVLYYYLTEKRTDVDGDAIKKVGERIKKEEYEDSFEKYYRPFPLFKGIKSTAGGFAYGVRGKLLENPKFAVGRVECDSDSLYAAAKKYGCSVTAFLTALLAYAIKKAHDGEEQSERYIFFIPVNYRKFFPSETLYNFTGFARCIVPKGASFEIENLCEILKKELSRELGKEELLLKLSFSSLPVKNVLLRIFPFFIKKSIAVLARNAGKRTKQTMIVSNLGKSDFPGVNAINRFTFYLNCNRKTSENVGIVTYKNRTQIYFSRRILSDGTEKEFVKILSEFCTCTLSCE